MATPTPTETEEGAPEGEEGDAVKEDEREQDPDDQPGMWEETFKTHHDSKPYGKGGGGESGSGLIE